MIKTTRPKILYITFRVLYPPNYGYQIRAFNLGRILASKYKVDLLAISEEKIDEKSIQDLNKIFNKVIIFYKKPYQFLLNAFLGIFKEEPLQVSYYYFRDIQDWINSHYKEYDLIFCLTIRTTKYLQNIDIKKTVDLIDAISLNYQTAAKIRKNFFWKFIYSFENKRLLPYEQKALQDFDLGFITSNFDKKFITRERPELENKLLVIPNGVKPYYLRENNEKIKEKDWILFLGKMDYPPNEDAVIYFSREIFPALRKKIKNIGFLIVGGNLTKRVLRLKNISGVRLTGFVKDPSFYLRKAKIIVIPLRFCAGIQNKILEAMALGKAVITSPIAARGIEGKEGVHFLIAKDREDFIEKILELFSNSEKRKFIGKNAKELIKKKYTWQRIEEDLFSNISKIIF